MALKDKSTLTVRADEMVREHLKKAYDTLYNGGTRALELFVALRKQNLREIKGVFTREELVGLLSGFNGTIMEPQYMINQSMLIAHIEDADIYEFSFSSNNADSKVVIEKVKTLSSAQILFLQEEINRFWNQDSAYNSDIEKFIENFV